MKQVLFIFFQTGDNANGGTKSMANIVLNLQQFAPSLLTQKETLLNQQFTDKSIPLIVKPLNERGKLKKLFNLIFFNIKVWRILLGSPIDVVHINDIRALMHSWLGVKMAGRKIVFNIRDVYEPQIPYPSHWSLVNICDHVVVLSDNMKETLLERLPLRNRHLWSNKFTSIYSIVSSHVSTPNTKSLRQIKQRELDFSANNVIHLAYVASFNDKKNQRTFLREFMPLLKRKNIHVHFIGDYDEENDPYAKACSTFIKGKYSEQVFVHGFQSNVVDYYQACDITIVPTKREGLARCMIESIACGTPVISFDVCSAHEILSEHQCGVVVPQGDYKQLLHEVQSLVGSPTRYQQYQSNGIALAQQLFDKDIIIAQYEQVYQSQNSN